MKRQWILIIAITIIMFEIYSEIRADEVEKFLAASTAASQNNYELLEIDTPSDVVEEEFLAPAVDDNVRNASYLNKKTSKISENKSREKIIISAQRENQLIITTGDMVYLKTAGQGELKKGLKYVIYKEVTRKDMSDRKNTMILYEPLGKLRILEVNHPLSLAKVIEAQGIIQKGDFVFAGRQP